MDNPGEILRLCRLCLVKDQVNIPIFAEQGDSREIFLKISSCLPVKVSIEDRLPKKICDGCSEKLNSFYEFWSSSANAEKTLLSWLGEDEVEEKKVQAVPKSLTASATLVKEESAELVDEAHAESIEESTKDESEAPPTKRARRSAAVKAQINLAPDSEDDDLDTTEPLTKMEEESADSDGEEKDPSYTEMPGTSADDEQAGPSGMGKDGVEAPKAPLRYKILKKNSIEPEDSLAGCFKFRDHNNKLIVITNTDRGYPCCYCLRPFRKRFDLKEHIYSHMLKNHKPFYLWICEPCNKLFRSEQSFFSHRKSVHMSVDSFFCQGCGQVFSNGLDCQRHWCAQVFGVSKPVAQEEDIVMPIITSFGTVTDDTESKKRPDVTSGYETEYAKFLAVAGKEAPKVPKEKEKKRKSVMTKVFIVEKNVDDTVEVPLGERDPLVLTSSPPLKSDNAKPKIFVKEFANLKRVN